MDGTNMSPPAKRVCDMTPEERLESLRLWCEGQKYVAPGDGGTLSFGIGGLRDMRTQSYSGPIRYVPPQYTAPIAPPSYETIMIEKEKASKPSKNRLKSWLGKKRKDKQRSKSVA